MSGSTLPQAFRLVRQLLSERPRAFQEILRDGLPSTSTSTSASANPNASLKSNKGKGKLVAGESHVPANHPFISANYLKTRVLPILTSQGLITKSKSKSPSGSMHMYTLTPSPLLPAHWDRLLSGESPSTVGHEFNLQRKEELESRKAIREEADGTADEAARLMWYRNSKAMGRLAAPLDRGFLNRRKAKKRYGGLKDREGMMEVLMAGAEPWPEADPSKVGA